MERAHVIYLHNLEEHILPHYGAEAHEKSIAAKTKLTGLLCFSLPQKEINEKLSEFLQGHAESALGLQSEPSTADQHKLRQNIRRLVGKLQDVGLGGSRFQTILAEVMSQTLTAYIKQTYAGQWHSECNVTKQLRHWIENHFARYIVEVLATLTTGRNGQSQSETQIPLADVEKWQEIAVNRLGALRTEELFSIIVEWDSDGKGAIEDLKRYVTTTAARTHLTTSFGKVLDRRLLQPGAATIEIMQMYISIIRAFSLLDPKGVLLDRIARPIRRYLRERDDTVSIMVSSLLADADHPPPPGTHVLPELAEEMENGKGNRTMQDNDDDLDFDDMEWMPAPIDAGPEYKRSKHFDVIGSLISLFETKDVFVKDFQKVLGERLLKNQQYFDKETRVLELLKLRFGESPLQACEVMLRDIQDSGRVDRVIRGDPRHALERDNNRPNQPEIHARVLSHLFWPSLQSESFWIPPIIDTLQLRWASGFCTLKQARKLTWLNALGQVTVELELEDRTINEVVQTWQASVIFAFQSNHKARVINGNVMTKSVSQLMTQLSMSEFYVRNALTFWVGKLVLRPSSTHPDVYYVLENLPSSALHPGLPTSGTASNLLTAAAAADAATSAPAPAMKSEEEIRNEKMEVFWQFVVGMLTNQGAMPLVKIVMMLKVVVPGGFPFGNEDLKQFLEGRVREGNLEVVGGNYRMAG